MFYFRSNLPCGEEEEGGTVRIAEYDPFDHRVLAAPHPWLRLLREEAPVHCVASRGYWIFTRFADIHAALRDHTAFSSAKGNAPEPGFQLGLIAADPPKHTRLRRIVQSVFTPKTIERAWGERIQQICARLADEAVEAGSIDAFRSLTLPLPVQVIAELLGVSDGDLAQFKRWSDAMVEGVSLHLDDAVKARTEAAFRELMQYFFAKLAERRARPTGDLVTMIAEAGGDERLTDKEAAHFCVLLLIAGNETTTNLLGNGLLALMESPEEEAFLRQHPERLSDAIEEMLRYCPPTQAVFREATRETLVGNATIPAGARVMLSLVAGNRDPERHPEPDRFWIERPEQEHLAFGSGIHFCLGSALARLEVRTMLTALLERTRAFRRTGEAQYASSVVVRGPTVLPMELVAR
ncbi:MAG TPA: cytochrome P450 [Polyangiaceae bacterium]